MRLSSVIPLIIGAFAVADVAARFVPLDFVAFRAWETMVVNPAPTGVFRANVTYRNLIAHGDLSSIGNYPELHQYRVETATTDRFGWRNPPELSEHPERLGGFVIGDSFAAGAGLSDGDTLAAQLGARLGKPLYNLGGGVPGRMPTIRDAARRLDLGRGVLVYEIMERLDSPHVNEAEVQTYRPDLPPEGTAPTLRDQIEQAWKEHQVSRLQIVLRRLEQAALLKLFPVQEARSAQVVARSMTNGDEMLFMSWDIGTGDRVIAPDFFVWAQPRLKEIGLTLVVVLVPSKYHVYEQYLRPHSEPKPSPNALNRLEAKLRAAGVPVVNATGVLSSAAAELYPSRQYVYWRDDSHWSPEGVRRVADVVADAVRTACAADGCGAGLGMTP